MCDDTHHKLPFTFLDEGTHAHIDDIMEERMTFICYEPPGYSTMYRLRLPPSP